ncbi:LPS translocon maturation chaperone LptM [Legionella hackeliae]|nr:lipoprotein [Legionella hackeliae]
MRLIILICITVLTLSACGQKGPLYLPKPAQQQSQTP